MAFHRFHISMKIAKAIEDRLGNPWTVESPHDLAQDYTRIICNMYQQRAAWGSGRRRACISCMASHEHPPSPADHFQLCVVDSQELGPTGGVNHLGARPFTQSHLQATPLASSLDAPNLVSLQCNHRESVAQPRVPKSCFRCAVVFN